ncbi:protein SKIP34 [Quercus lobata]|uniref:Protein SKIP34 n=1 Tax=Quercus lobata TaxID=97700 RepID=A0A7N2LZF8_QUELO|nr:protein SKIP34 [Quercus lobata]
MCYGQHQAFSRDSLSSSTRQQPPATENNNNAEDVVDNLRDRLADTEARLARARAREAELSQRLEEMKRFVSVMEILETYLKRRFREQQEHVDRLFKSLPA